MATEKTGYTHKVKVWLLEAVLRVAHAITEVVITIIAGWTIFM